MVQHVNLKRVIKILVEKDLQKVKHEAIAAYKAGACGIGPKVYACKQILISAAEAKSFNFPDDTKMIFTILMDKVDTSNRLLDALIPCIKPMDSFAVYLQLARIRSVLRATKAAFMFCKMLHIERNDGNPPNFLLAEDKVVFIDFGPVECAPYSTSLTYEEYANSRVSNLFLEHFVAKGRYHWSVPPPALTKP